MKDPIERQAAIDRIRGTGYADQIKENVIMILMCLPSAQPEIIRCKDCKHKHIENMVWTCPFGLPGGENFFCGYGAESYKGEQE